MLLTVLVILMISFGEGCKTSPVFTPHFYRGDSARGGITNARGETVLATEEKFNEYGCLHKEEIKELLRVLRKKIKEKRIENYIKAAGLIDEWANEDYDINTPIER